MIQMTLTRNPARAKARPISAVPALIKAAPPLLELHLHLLNGTTRTFVQNDPDLARQLLQQVGPRYGPAPRGELHLDPFPDDKNEYALPTIKKWLGLFLFRFFQTSQFKRPAVPNGPKVGSGGSLSPRGDWRAPSDSDATVWLKELQENVPD